MVAERFESALWKTSSLLLAARGEAVLIDPGISAEEVARVAARADELGVRVTNVLATHADWDHVCGIAAFPDAVATMGELAATRVVSRSPDAGVAHRAAAYGLRIAGEPRVDRTFEPGVAAQVGPFLVETLALPGHTPDGVAYRFRELELLAVGDHLSAVAPTCGRCMRQWATRPPATKHAPPHWQCRCRAPPPKASRRRARRTSTWQSPSSSVQAAASRASASATASGSIAMWRCCAPGISSTRQSLALASAVESR